MVYSERSIVAFWAKVNRHGPTSRLDLGACWLWTGAVSRQGYGIAHVRSQEGISSTVRAHRLAYLLTKGGIPTDLELDHLCRIRLCVTPDHLEPTTHVENVRRGAGIGLGAAFQRAKTHCPAGHPYDEANTYRIPSRPNARYCRACDRAKKQHLAQAQV